MAVAAVLSCPRPAWALDVLGAFLTDSESGFGDAGLGIYGDAQPDLYYFQRPSLLPESPSGVGMLWRRENLFNIKAGDWRGSHADDQEMTLRGQWQQRHASGWLQRSAVKIALAQDKSEAWIRNRPQEVVARYKSIEHSFRMSGMIETRIPRIQLGVTFDDYLDLVGEKTSFNFGGMVYPFWPLRLGVGWHRYAEYFNLEVISRYEDDSAFVPFRYLRNPEEWAIRFEAPGRVDLRLEFGNPHRNRLLQQTGYRGEIRWFRREWTFSAQMSNHLTGFDEFILEDNPIGNDIGRVQLSVRRRLWAVDGRWEFQPHHGVSFSLGDQRILSGSEGVSIGDLIAEIILGGAIDVNLFYQGSLGVHANQLRLGYDFQSADGAFGLKSGVQYIQMRGESGKVSYGTFGRQSIQTPATTEDINALASTVRLGVWAFGLDYGWGRWRVGYDGAQYFPISVFDRGGGGGGGGGGGSGDGPNALEKLRQTLHDYRGGNVHRLSLTYRF